MDSKILFTNETTYTQEIALEAGETFWKVQPAYKKKAKRFRILAGIIALTFLVLAVAVTISQGITLIGVAGLAMALTAGVGSFKAESLIRNSAKKLRGLYTKTTYGISENFFFVIDREYVGNTNDDQQKSLDAPAEDTSEEEEEEEEEETEETNEFANEIFSLEDLLVCIVTEKIYILIWERPYYILDRKGFDEEKDTAFRKFIEEKARIIEA